MQTFSRTEEQWLAGFAFGRSSGLGRNAGFTLVELLVVMAAIAMLTAMLLAAVWKAKVKALQTTCYNNYKQIGYAAAMYCADFNDCYPWCRSWGRAWGDDHALGKQYLPELLLSLLGKNSGSNQPAGRMPGGSVFICPLGFRARDPAISNLQLFFRHNDDVTYVWNHIYLTGDRRTYDVAHPVSGRKASNVANSTSAVLLWEMPYSTPSCSPHQGGMNLIFADCHAAWERRRQQEFDWWAYHSRRGWDDNNTGL